MRLVIAFLRFWYDFIVGDDWRVAVAVALAIGLTALLSDAGISSWWVLPFAVVTTLFVSLSRATGRGVR